MKENRPKRKKAPAKPPEPDLGETLAAYGSAIATLGQTPLGKATREFLNESRNNDIRLGRLPETVESHCDFEPLGDYLRPCETGFSKNNRIWIDLGMKTKNEALKEILAKRGFPPEEKALTPTINAAAFLHEIDTILAVVRWENSQKKEDRFDKTSKKIEVMAAIAMAFLELLEETNENPIPEAGSASTRPKKIGGAEIGVFKEILIAQSREESAPEDTPSLTPELLAQTAAECQENITTGEAVQLAIIHAERQIEHLKSKKKRETLFRMRARLAAEFFEALKGRRKEGHPQDLIIAQKPRYKTPCLFVVRHPKNERAEVVCIQPQSSANYWGNPEAEKETHAIMTRTTTTPWADRMEVVAGQIHRNRHRILIATGVLIALAVGLIIGATLLRKGENAARPATPLPEATTRPVGNLGSPLELRNLPPR